MSAENQIDYVEIPVTDLNRARTMTTRYRQRYAVFEQTGALDFRAFAIEVVLTA